ncbi:hypothetical protein FRD01_02595 [Microvenator marinus]|uniref:Uncharacterized protein n=1 Tax=Microvenator marinus TaxID=2600177 RepID=A0A5B8XKQ5_9DELT|nr:hypothetical protein [Microvenator marinus]QED26165.1 hypothetical protein FRD01_02595 [Microvenator marinus]
MKPPEHVILIGRKLIAYDGSNAYVAQLYFKHGALLLSCPETQWEPSPAHDLSADCAKLVQLGEGALAYDTQGTAYHVGSEEARVCAHLEWNPVLSRARAENQNREYLDTLRAKFAK